MRRRTGKRKGHEQSRSASPEPNISGGAAVASPPEANSLDESLQSAAAHLHVESSVHDSLLELRQFELDMCSHWRHNEGFTNTGMQIVKEHIRQYVLKREEIRSQLLSTHDDSEQQDFINNMFAFSFWDPLTAFDIRSTHMELAEYDKKFKPVKPVKRTFGTSSIEIDTPYGPRQIVSEDEVVEVPMLQALQQVFSCPEVQADLAKERPLTETINDISDGTAWFQHPLADQNPIRLGLYFDAIEYCEAIGAFRMKQKATHFYAVILNLSMQVRMKKEHVILVASVFDKVMKKPNVGVCTVVSGSKANAAAAEGNPPNYAAGVDLGEWCADTSLGAFLREAYSGKHVFDLPHNPSTGLGPGPRPVVLQVVMGDRLAIHEAMLCKMAFNPKVHKVCFQCDCSGCNVAIVQNFLVPSSSDKFKLSSTKGHSIDSKILADAARSLCSTFSSSLSHILILSIVCRILENNKYTFMP